MHSYRKFIAWPVNPFLNTIKLEVLHCPPSIVLDNIAFKTDCYGPNKLVMLKLNWLGILQFLSLQAVLRNILL